MSSALVSSRSPAFGSGRLRGPIDITTRRSAPDLLVIGIALRVSERLPLVATSTLGGRPFGPRRLRRKGSPGSPRRCRRRGPEPPCSRGGVAHRKRRGGAEGRVASMAVSDELRRKREELVIEHMESENRHEFDVDDRDLRPPALRARSAPARSSTAPRRSPRYFEETRTAFPDQRNELIALHHADDAVIVEADLYGTHQGPLRGLPPTGRRFEMRSAPCSCSRRTAWSASASTSTRTRSFASSASPTTLRP